MKKLRIMKKIKSKNSYTNVSYYPQYYREPLIVFGVTILKGKWKCIDKVVFNEAGSGSHRDVCFKDAEAAQHYLNSIYYEEINEYIEYQ